jgi:hypothetical protein
MSDQYFFGPVEQVAGRNIVNPRLSRSYAEMDTPDLIREDHRYYDLIRDAQRRQRQNPATIGMLACAPLFFLWTVTLSGLTQQALYLLTLAGLALCFAQQASLSRATDRDIAAYVGKRQAILDELNRRPDWHP